MAFTIDAVTAERAGAPALALANRLSLAGLAERTTSPALTLPFRSRLLQRAHRARYLTCDSSSTRGSVGICTSDKDSGWAWKSAAQRCAGHSEDLVLASRVLRPDLPPRVEQ